MPCWYVVCPFLVALLRLCCWILCPPSGKLVSHCLPSCLSSTPLLLDAAAALFLSPFFSPFYAFAVGCCARLLPHCLSSCPLLLSFPVSLLRLCLLLDAAPILASVSHSTPCLPPVLFLAFALLVEAQVFLLVSLRPCVAVECCAPILAACLLLSTALRSSRYLFLMSPFLCSMPPRLSWCIPLPCLGLGCWARLFTACFPFVPLVVPILASILLDSTSAFLQVCLSMVSLLSPFLFPWLSPSRPSQSMPCRQDRPCLRSPRLSPCLLLPYFAVGCCARPFTAWVIIFSGLPFCPPS